MPGCTTASPENCLADYDNKKREWKGSLLTTSSNPNKYVTERGQNNNVNIKMPQQSNNNEKQFFAGQYRLNWNKLLYYLYSLNEKENREKQETDKKYPLFIVSTHQRALITFLILIEMKMEKNMDF